MYPEPKRAQRQDYSRGATRESAGYPLDQVVANALEQCRLYQLSRALGPLRTGASGYHDPGYLESIRWRLSEREEPGGVWYPEPDYEHQQHVVSNRAFKLLHETWQDQWFLTRGKMERVTLFVPREPKPLKWFEAPTWDVEE